MAVVTLHRNLTCGHPGTEVRASEIILTQATKGVELWDLLQRVEELEQRAEQEKQDRWR
jgi:hypothetical protein